MLRRLQRNFISFVSKVIIESINRYFNTEYKIKDITIVTSYIDSRNDKELIESGAKVADMLKPMREYFGDSEALRRYMLSLFVKSVNMDIPAELFEEIIKDNGERIEQPTDN